MSSASQLIDDRIEGLGGWRGEMLARLRAWINSSLEGRVRRAIDFHEGEKINAAALKALIRASVAVNKSS